jgi:hypothetical protein
MNKKVNNFNMVTFRIILVAVILVSLVSCGPTNNSNVKSEPTSVESTPVLLQELNSAPDVEIPNTETTEKAAEIAVSDEIEETNSLVSINPPHGQPGHSCDIPVGAPLSNPTTSAAVQATAKPTTQTTPTVPVIPANLSNSVNRVGPTIQNLQNFRPSQPGNTTVSINPAHGQPGHRCDIAVGDPLPTASTTGNVTINPPHGQPGHRCDIAVGDPLPS